MGDENYEKLVSIIVKSSDLEKEEIEKKINAKREKISGLISKEGAAQIIAAELGISFDSEKLKIDEILSGMRKVNILAKVINISPIRTFTRNGQEGKVVNLFVADETSNIRVVLWDTNHIELIEAKKINEGNVIEIFNANIRDNELHLSSFSELKLSDEVFEKVQTEKVVKRKDIIDFKISDNASVRAFIVQSFEPKFFNVCNECKKKVNNEGDGFVCVEHGKIIGEKRVLLNLVLDDGTATIRGVLFNENLKSLGFTQMDDSEFLNRQKQNLIGKEMIFSGNIRMNKFFNNPEFIIDDVTEINVDELIGELETR